MKTAIIVAAMTFGESYEEVSYLVSLWRIMLLKIRM